MGTSQAIVDLLTSHISQGAYRAGERLPSLRELGQLHKISIARAVRIYASLVDAGLVEVRDRAGYFVSAKSAPDRCTPAPLMDDAADFESFVVTTLGSKPNQERVSFSAAYPGSDLFPIGELHRLLRVASRVQLPGSFVYEDAQGLLALRQRISRLYATAGKNVAASEIVTTSGGIEAVQLALSACARSGKAVVGVESPSFYPLLQALLRFGLRPLSLPADPVRGLDIDATVDLMRRGRVNALMLTPTFSNPLGYALDHDARRTLAEAADRYGVAIVENDPYRDLFFGDSVPPSIKHFDEAGWVLHCGSFSNNLAPGYNVGWLAAGRFASRVRALRFFSNMTAGLLPQRTIASYLGTGVSRGAYARHLLSLRTKLRERMALGLELLGNVLPAQARFTRPAGGFMVWVTLPKGMDALELNRRAQSRDISIAPGPLYCLSGRHRNAFALNFGWKWDSRRTAALEQIGSLIASDRRR